MNMLVSNSSAISSAVQVLIANVHSCDVYDVYRCWSKNFTATNKNYYGGLEQVH
jgi:hypothetical protein